MHHRPLKTRPLALEISSDFIAAHIVLALVNLENMESQALKNTYFVATFAALLVNGIFVSGN